MKKAKFVRILQCALTGLLLWQTRAFAQYGCPNKGSCAPEWTDPCGGACTNSGILDGAGPDCCSPITNQCCEYSNTYHQCYYGIIRCSDEVEHVRTQDAKSGMCTTSGCSGQ